MGVRGPFRCATSGMAEWERRDWWKAMGEIELTRARIPSIARGEKDLGIKLPGEPTGRTIRHQKRKLGDRGAIAPEEEREYYHQAHVTRSYRG